VDERRIFETSIIKIIKGISAEKIRHTGY
jgi:hypothetical protein